MERDATAPAETGTSTEITLALTRIRRLLRLRIRSEFPWETMPMAQVEFLQRLHDEPDLRVSDLAQRHRMANNTVSTIIRQMAAEDLVSRTPDPHDRRVVRVSMTDKGERDLGAWMRANEALIEQALEGLDEEDRRAISAATPALLRLADRLDGTE